LRPADQLATIAQQLALRRRRTKLLAISPWRTKSAIHSASFASTRHVTDLLGVADEDIVAPHGEGD